MLGYICYQRRDLERAVELIGQALALRPDYAEAHFNQAVALQDLERPAQAVACYDRVIALRPDMAAAHYNRGNALRSLNQPEAALAAYDRAIAIRPDYAEAHLNRGMALQEMKRPEIALSSYGQAIAVNPDYAEAYSNRGAVLRELKRPSDAVAEHERARVLKPDHAENHSNLGLALQDLSRAEEALACFDRAVALKPDFAEAHSNRGGVLRELKRYPEALESFDRAIGLKADYAAAHYNRGLALQDLGRPVEAIDSYDRAIALAPEQAQPRWTQALALMQVGQLAEGWRRYEWRKQGDKPTGHRAFPQPLWLGQTDLGGKTLFIHCEQGFGDSLQFCRYASLAADRGARVVMAVQNPVVRLLRRMDPRIEVIGEAQAPAAFDLHCPMLSLPLAFATTIETIPAPPFYLTADPADVLAWRDRLGAASRPRIGLVWSGSTIHKNDHNRSAPLARLARLFDLDCDWISLQKELREPDRATLASLPQIRLVGETLADFADTAALIETLDLVITVDTSIAHLTGALGKPVWILLPFNPDWRWLLGRADSPWYPNARLFRQPAIDAWEPVVAAVREALVEAAS